MIDRWLAILWLHWCLSRTTGWFYVTTKNVKPSFAHISLGLYLSIFLQCHITAAFLTVNTNPQFDGYLPLPKAPKGPQQDPKMGRGTSYLNRSSGSGLLTTSRKHGTSKTSRAKINHWVGVGRKYAMNRSSPLTFKPFSLAFDAICARSAASRGHST